MKASAQSSLPQPMSTTSRSELLHSCIATASLTQSQPQCLRKLLPSIEEATLLASDTFTPPVATANTASQAARLTVLRESGTVTVTTIWAAWHPIPSGVLPFSSISLQTCRLQWRHPCNAPAPPFGTPSRAMTHVPQNESESSVWVGWATWLFRWQPRWAAPWSCLAGRRARRSLQWRHWAQRSFTQQRGRRRLSTANLSTDSS